jgi:hypothetical protein
MKHELINFLIYHYYFIEMKKLLKKNLELSFIHYSKILFLFLVVNNLLEIDLIGKFSVKKYPLIHNHYKSASSTVNNFFIFFYYLKNSKKKKKKIKKLT